MIDAHKQFVTLAGSRVKISDLPADIAAAVLAELHPEPEPAGPPQLAQEPPKMPEPAPESARATIARPGSSLTTPDPVEALPVGEADTLERNGEDLQYLAGRWFHRCNQCGEWERLLLIRKGRNPVNVLSPVFRVPRGEPIRHAPDCPHAGQF